MSAEWCAATGGGVRLTVHIAPAAKKNEVVGVLGNQLKIRLQAPPIEGRANAALIRYLAERLDLPKNRVRVLHGSASRHKVIEIDAAGLTPAQVRQVLWPGVEDAGAAP